jgi:hypothetical protein
MAAATEMMLLHPADVADVLDSRRRDEIQHLIGRLRRWMDELEGAMSRPLHLVDDERTGR